MNIHTVKPKESLGEIAGLYGISPIKLAENNGIGMRSKLIPGEELLILVPTRTTNARSGERLSELGQRFGVSEQRLLALNPELCGRSALYSGQPIAVKYGSPRYGLGIGNGYLYRGTTRDSLLRALPYLNIVTVSSVVGRHGGVSSLFDDKEALSLIRAAGKRASLRIWLPSEEKSERLKMISCASLMAKASGYNALTLSGTIGEGKEGEEVMLEAKKMTNECDINLYLECDVTKSDDTVDYADAVILTYDKIHLSKIPSFEEGERVEFTRYTELHNGLRAFIDLSPFALTGGKYITKSEAREAILRQRGEMVSSGCEGYIMATTGSGKRERLYIQESMKNTQKKLELVSELGYYGISFDIARAPIYELMMWRVMFSEGIGVL